MKRDMLSQTENNSAQMLHEDVIKLTEGELDWKIGCIIYAKVTENEDLNNEMYRRK